MFGEKCTIQGSSGIYSPFQNPCVCLYVLLLQGVSLGTTKKLWGHPSNYQINEPRILFRTILGVDRI